MIVIDTSAWVEYFRSTGSSAATEVRAVLSGRPNDVVMCEPVAMEILAGAGDQMAYEKLERLVNGLPTLTFDAVSDFRSAAGIYRAARHAGRTIRSLNDCLIAAVVIRHGAELLHRDSDFDIIASITPLAATSLR